ncbi:class I SAM-dependent methyltransferase [Microbacterium karelineae]|uniref:class I SAM-dependent methyltransferase n=1 Tax=Microbacterium karelineae TaxID=2654283 RepID=UPI0018D2AFCE|nr:class I SAM-dependent methyltransferase [Microbacterium karelineae]
MTSDLRVPAARSFEAGADAYEAHRPPYPDALFDDILSRVGGSPLARILDIGAGTGRATIALASRGANVDALEPSNDMLGVLTRRVRQEGLDDRVTVRKAVFEDLSLDARYDAIVAAQSFHWTDPDTRWSRLASLLGSDGRAFLFWNAWSLDADHHDLDAVATIYAAHAPELPPDLPRDLVSRMWADGQIDAHPDVRLADRITYGWDVRMSAADYIRLLATISQYAITPAAQREGLFTALEPALGEEVHLRGTTLLLVVAKA